MLMSSKKKASKKRTSKLLPCMNPSLPQDIIDDILARVPRCYYPTLSLVSKHFRSLVASPEIYTRRSLLGCTEYCLYVLLFDRETHKHHSYILRQKANGTRDLVLIPSLPAMHIGSFVALGTKIYVFGINHHSTTTDAFSIDCRSHTVQPLPSIPIFMFSTGAGIIDGKIYVTGYHYKNCTNVILVFDTETQTWEHCLNMQDMDIQLLGCVVMDDKIYMRDSQNSFVYKPKENKWETDGMLNLKKWKNACVVNDVLYYHDSNENCLRTYDPKKRCWGVVRGLENQLAVTEWSNTVSYDGKLALFSSKGNFSTSDICDICDICCAEISLEIHQGGEIWGKVEWCNHLLTGKFGFYQLLAVMV